MVAQTCKPSTSETEAGNQEFKVTLSYTLSLRLVWVREALSQKIKKKETKANYKAVLNEKYMVPTEDKLLAIL